MVRDGEDFFELCATGYAGYASVFSNTQNEDGSRKQSDAQIMSDSKLEFLDAIRHWQSQWHTGFQCNRALLIID
jgi:hypothetical protein